MFFMQCHLGLSSAKMRLIADLIRGCMRSPNIRAIDVPLDTRTSLSRVNVDADGRLKVLEKVFEIPYATGADDEQGIKKATFYHFSPLEVLQDLLSSKPLPSNGIWQHEAEKVKLHGRKELQDGEFWAFVTEKFTSIPSLQGVVPVPVILYCDATQVGKMSTKSPKPIYMTIAHYNLRERQTFEAKRLLGNNTTRLFACIF